MSLNLKMYQHFFSKFPTPRQQPNKPYLVPRSPSPALSSDKIKMNTIGFLFGRVFCLFSERLCYHFCNKSVQIAVLTTRQSLIDASSNIFLSSCIDSKPQSTG